MAKSWESKGELAKGVQGVAGMNSTLAMWRAQAVALKAQGKTTWPGGGNEVQRAILDYVLTH